MEEIQSFPAKKAVANPYFSILIPSWNNLPYLKLCIKSVRKYAQVPYELIVHLNESADGSKEWVEEQEDISFSFSKNNVGVCHAMNAMRTLANANYLLYLNDDMYVLPSWDLELKNEIDSCGTNKFFFSSTMIEPRAQSSCSIQANFGNNIENFQEEKLVNSFRNFTFDDWQGSTWPPNVVHKDFWDLIGGYSVEFSPGMYSDPDFSMKLWNQGVRLFKGLGSSRVYHFGSISVKRVKQNKGYYQFIRQWRMTSSTFSKYYLRRGFPFEGILNEPQIPLLVQLKNLGYRLYLLFKKD